MDYRKNSKETIALFQRDAIELMQSFGVITYKEKEEPKTEYKRTFLDDVEDIFREFGLINNNCQKENNSKTVKKEQKVPLVQSTEKHISKPNYREWAAQKKKELAPINFI